MIKSNIIILLAISLFSFACGGDDGETQSGLCYPGTTQPCLGPGACEGAQVCAQDGLVWGECVCGTAPTGGTGGDNLGGTGNIPGTGGSGNVGTGGVGTGGGTGGVINPPPTGGTGGTCTPKTCDQIALDLVGGWNTYDDLSAPLACGWAPDGCGGLINCGDCPTDGTVNTGCGQSANSTSYPQFPVVVANVCGTRCVKNEESTRCETVGASGKDSWTCPSTIPPIGKTNCQNVRTANEFGVTGWCCDPS